MATRRTGRSAVVALGATGALIASGLPAAAMPFELEYPTVFISQMLSGSVTTMRAAEQSRGARDGLGGVEIASLPAGAASFAYNAVDYRPSDNYLYGVSSDRQLVRVGQDGTAERLGAISGLTAAMYSGAFGEDPDILFARPTGSSTQLRLIDVDSRTSTALNLLQRVNMNDFTFSEGYLWGVEVRDVRPALPEKWLMRIHPSSGEVTEIDVTEHFPAADGNGGLDTGYGAAWVYGNGNLAFSYNDTGNITQIRVTNPAAVTPGVERISTIAGPATAQNDGATSPSSPTNLTLDITSPEPSAPGEPITWTVTVENSGDAGSSGATFNFPVPEGVELTDDLDLGCTLEANVVQCVVGQLAPGESDTYEFEGTAPSPNPVSAGSTVTVIGNELDPEDNTAYFEITAQPQVLTSTGVGTAAQVVTVPVPGGGTLNLLDGETPVTTLVIEGTGTYSVSGSALTFRPVLGFTGDAPAALFRITFGPETGTGTYTATVTPPAAPAPTELRTTGTSPALQTTIAEIPPSGSVSLLDADGEPATTLTVVGGSYAIDVTSGVITFTPDARFTGEAPAAPFRVTDAYGQTGEGQYVPTVVVPAGPSASPYTSTGVGTEVQHPATTVPVPQDGSVHLVGPEGPAVSVTVEDEGTYSVAPDSGQLSFAPVLGFVGDATAVTYRVTDAYGQTAESTYTATVAAPDAPVATNRTSTGVGTQPQGATVTVPAGGSIALVGSGTVVNVSGQGTYRLDARVGTITFTPVLGFQGQADGVAFRVTDAYGQPAEAIYTPTVTPPAAPMAPDATSTGPALTPQVTTITVPEGGTVALVGGESPTRVVVEDEGIYELDPTSGVLTFTPVLGFAGESHGVAVIVTDAYGQSGTGAYTPTVTAPPAPQPLPLTTEGVGTETQTTMISVPEHGSVALVGGESPTRVVVDGEGTYELDPSTGVVTFTPELGFAGEAGGVSYRVTDIYGQASTAVFTPTVEAPPATALPPLASSGPAEDTQGVTVPVPDGGSVRLVDDGRLVTTLTVDGEGTYVLDPRTGAIRFTPVPGFAGQTDGVTIRVTDAYGQTAEASYAPVVIAPAPPTATPLTSSGPMATPQRPSSVVTVPQGGSVTLLEDGRATTSVVVPGQGMYSLDPATGELTFTPVASFAGEATPVEFRVTDAYGQSATSTYTATVEAGPNPAGSAPGSALADTGVRLVPLLGAAALLLLSGAALLVAGRRREQRA